MVDLREFERLVPAQAPILSARIKGDRHSFELGGVGGRVAKPPDKEFVQFLVNGIREGFRIGYNYSGHSCKSSSRNMVSAGSILSRYSVTWPRRWQKVESSALWPLLYRGGGSKSVASALSEASPAGEVAANYRPLFPRRLQRE